MKKIVYGVSFLDKKTKLIEQNKSVRNQNAVIFNTLISNDISDDWDYTKGKMVLFSALLPEMLVIYIKDNKHDLDFEVNVRKFMKETATKYADKIYSFNNKFEQGVIKGNMRYLVDIKDIRGGFLGKGWNKRNILFAMRELGIIDDFIMNLYSENEIKEKYKRYLDDKNEDLLSDVIVYSIIDTIQEAIILKYGQEVLRKIKAGEIKNG